MSRVLSSLAAVAAAAGLAACGSSSHPASTTTSAPSTTHASAATTTRPRAVAHVAAVPGQRATVAVVKRFGRVPAHRAHAHLSGLDGLSLSQKLGVLVPQSAQLWQIVFSKTGQQLPAASAYLVTAGQSASCGSTTVTSTSAPDYCPSNASIYLPADFLQAKIEPLGDAALLLIVSDLYSLHVENALGVLGSATTAQIETTEACFSGMAFDYAQYKQELTPADEQGVNSLLALEAPVAGQSAGGVSAAKLTQAFNLGLLSGTSFQKCLPASS